jgi:hypothetical protein
VRPADVPNPTADLPEPTAEVPAPTVDVPAVPVAEHGAAGHDVAEQAVQPTADAPRYRFGFDDIPAHGMAGAGGSGWNDWRPAGSRNHWRTPGRQYQWAGTERDAVVLPETGADTGGTTEAGGLAIGLLVAGGALRRFRRT